MSPRVPLGAFLGLLATTALAAKPLPGQFPLHEAAATGQLERVKTLVATLGVDAKGDDDATPLHVGAAHGHDAVARFLVARGANLKAKTGHGVTVLHAAAAGGLDWLVAKALDAGVPVGSLASNRTTPLHLAAGQGRRSVIALLLRRRAAVDAKDSLGYTPLHTAIDRGQVEAARLLLARRAAFDAGNDHNWTPLVVALYRKQPALAEELIRRGARTEITLTGEPDYKGFRPLHLALLHGLRGVARLLLARNAQIGGAVDGQYYRGWTALHLAAAFADAETCKALLKKGADATAKTGKGQTVAEVASAANRPLFTPRGR